MQPACAPLRVGWRRDGSHGDDRSRAPSDLPEAYGRVRATTERLASVLSAEDQTVQTMPDVSPTKWHRAHVTWFFETFVLGEYADGLPRLRRRVRLHLQLVLRGRRGPASPPRTRPPLTPWHRGDRPLPRLRRRGDGRLAASIPISLVCAELITLGLHHEQQHQELLAHGHQARALPQPPPSRLPGRRACRRRAPPAQGRLDRARRRPGRDRPPRARDSGSTTSSPSTRCT